MELRSETIKLLNLQPAEVAVLRALGAGPQFGSSLQRHTAIPRATLDRTLRSLRERGLIRKQEWSPKRGRWLLKPVTEIRILSSFGSTASGSEVFIYEGKEQLLNATLRFIETHAGERAFAIQSNKTWDTWATRLSREDFNKVNSLLRKKMVIMETVLPEDFAEYDLERRDQALANGYQERPSITHIIPKEFFNFYSDLTICRDAVFVMNWRDNLGIEIRNADLVSLFSSLFKYLQATGERVNLHEEVRSK